eukprot:4632637-Pyramimonas_sp.AAC.1
MHGGEVASTEGYDVENTQTEYPRAERRRSQKARWRLAPGTEGGGYIPPRLTRLAPGATRRA